MVAISGCVVSILYIIIFITRIILYAVIERIMKFPLSSSPFFMSIATLFILLINLIQNTRTRIFVVIKDFLIGVFKYLFDKENSGTKCKVSDIWM